MKLYSKNFLLEINAAKFYSAVFLSALHFTVKHYTLEYTL